MDSFDSELVASIQSILPDSSEKQISRWVQLEDPRDSAAAAIYVHNQLVNDVFGEYLNMDKIRSLYRRVLSYEFLIEIAVFDIGGKFYRDHICHSIRTALLSARLASDFGLHSEDVKSALFSALFQDLGYPVQQARNILKYISNSIGSTFSSIKISEGNVIYRDNASIISFVDSLCDWARRYELFKRDIIEEHFLDVFLTSVMSFHHGILSAFEIWTLLDNPSRELPWIHKAILAIALHDEQIFRTVEEDYRISCIARTLFPSLYVLVLADNLQEWRRPVFTKDRAAVYLVEGLSISKPAGRMIRIGLDY